jgi:uncharacterized protein YdiU (UPF0061 family)
MPSRLITEQTTQTPQAAYAGAQADPHPDAIGWRLDHSYTRLPQALYARQQPTPARAPQLVALNEPLARALGLRPEAQSEAAWAALCVGNAMPPAAQPIAQAYAGHQFGGFTMLGDGRAILMGEHLTPSGARVDVQWKGAGPTPFARRGDGRAALGPMLREYIVGEAMAALGIPTTRALAVATTGEPVYREAALPGAVLLRVAASHLRVGTFEFAAARGDLTTLRALASYAVARHDAGLIAPDLRASDPSAPRDLAPETYLAWLRVVVDRQASLVARWLHVGFVHGVMNTDNMAISGESIDFGPCAWIDTYDPQAVFSSIDHQGRYAYSNQPKIAQWNLARFAESLLPLLAPTAEAALPLAEAAICAFDADFKRHWLAGARAKLGLTPPSSPSEAANAADEALARDLLSWMHTARADYTHTWRALSSEAAARGDADPIDAPTWLARWRVRLTQQPTPIAAAVAQMRAHNPALIPRNHLVEAALDAATRCGDLTPTHALISALTQPFDDLPASSPFAAPPPYLARPYKTFCGT